MTHPRLTLITGATAGIGQAAAEAFAEAGWNLILTGRRNERLQQLAKQLQETHEVEVHTLCFDVRDRRATEQALDSLSPTMRQLDLLINNAGLARGFGGVDEGLIEDWEEMIDTNLKGLLYVSRIIAPWMKARGRGHIINVGSTAGKEAYPGGNVYCATKHGVDALTRGMRMDLIDSGVKVSAIHPGYVETEFSLVRFHGDAQRASQVYDGFQPLTGSDVAEVLLYMAQAPAHVNMADILLLPAQQASAMVVNRSQVQ